MSYLQCIIIVGSNFEVIYFKAFLLLNVINFSDYLYIFYIRNEWMAAIDGVIERLQKQRREEDRAALGVIPNKAPADTKTKTVLKV